MKEFNLRLASDEDDFTVIEDEDKNEPNPGSQPSSEAAVDSRPPKTVQLIRNLVIKETSLTLSVSLTKVITISFQNAAIRIREFRLA